MSIASAASGIWQSVSSALGSTPQTQSTGTGFSVPHHGHHAHGQTASGSGTPDPTTQQALSDLQAWMTRQQAGASTQANSTQGTGASTQSA